MPNVYNLYPAKFDDINLSQITAMSFSPGLQRTILRRAGSVDPRFIAINKVSPGITFTTTEIKRVLDKLGTPINGFPMTAETTAPFVFYLQEQPHHGTRATTSTFIKINITDCLVVPQSISFSDGGEATISVAVIPGDTDGSNVLEITSGVADPALSGTVDQVWTAGPLKVNSASLNAAKYLNIQGGSIDFGIGVTQISGSGSAFARHVSIGSRSPSISLALSDALSLVEMNRDGVSPVQNIGDALDEGSGTRTTVYLTRMQESGTRDQDATATHIAIAVPGGHIASGGLSVGDAQAATHSIVITPVVNDAGDPVLTFDTTAQII